MTTGAATRRESQSLDLSGAAPGRGGHPHTHRVSLHPPCPSEGWGAGEVGVAVQPCTASYISETRAVQCPRSQQQGGQQPHGSRVQRKVGKDEASAQMTAVHTESLGSLVGRGPRVGAPAPAWWGWPLGLRLPQLQPGGAWPLRLRLPLCSLPGPQLPHQRVG